MREPAFFQPSNLLAHRIRLLSALLIPLQEYVLIRRYIGRPIGWSEDVLIIDRFAVAMNELDAGLGF